MNYLVLILIFCTQYVAQSNGFYYWKDYRNKIPLDAFEAGRNLNNETIYIGQVFVKTDPFQGLYPTSILRGKDVVVAINGARKADNFIQILCSTDPDNLEWISTNATHLHLIKTDNELLRGGVERDAWLNIGRLKYQGDIVIGKVVSSFVGNADIWFVHNGNEIRAETYEVLTYNDIASKISVRTSNS